MQVGPEDRDPRTLSTKGPRIPFSLPYLSCFISVTCATVAVELFQRSEAALNVLWVANGLLITYLLLSPRWRWTGYMVAGIAGMAFGSALIGEHWQINVVYNTFNTLEVLVAALLLRGRLTQLPRFTNRRYLLRFVGSVVLAGPAFAGSLFALVQFEWHHMPYVQTFLGWVIGDGLGSAVAVPTFAAIFALRYSKLADLRRHWSHLAFLIPVTLIAFSQNRIPVFLLIFPLLVLVLIRLGLGWAALSTLVIASIGSCFSIHKFGPFAISSSDLTLEASIRMQFFVACCMFMIYVVSVILEDRKATENRLEQIADTHSLVTDNCRDIILLTDLDGRRRYISPAVEAMKGFKPEELIGENLTDLAHPEDRHKLDEAMQSLREGSDGVIVEYRARRRDGEYIWVESSLRIYRDKKTRVQAGILSLVRDVSERKHSERLLMEAYRSLEELAVRDALTGAANRRRFDESLAIEWNRAIRLDRPISLLLIDADSFKQHNDTYGHLHGDRYLKAIAQAAIEVARRPDDLVARIGGDEFAVILPGTENHAAMEMGAQVRSTLRQCFPDKDGASIRFSTISIGCATIVPRIGTQAMTLVQFADEALYAAKRSGGDQIWNRAHPSADPLPTRVTADIFISEIAPLADEPV